MDRLARLVVRWGPRLVLGTTWATRHLTRSIVRLVAGWVLVRKDSLPCPGCGEPVSLVSRWQCGWCDYVFDGFGFSRCEVCGAVPPFIDCQRCGHGLQNPMFFPSRGRSS